MGPKRPNRSYISSDVTLKDRFLTKRIVLGSEWEKVVDTWGPVGLPGRMFMLMVMVMNPSANSDVWSFWMWLIDREFSRRHQRIHEPLDTAKDSV